MIGPKTFTNYSFQIAIWGTVVFSIVMIAFGSLDLLLSLRWGFTLKDVQMAVVVFIGAVVVKVIGTKIIVAFGGGS